MRFSPGGPRVTVRGMVRLCSIAATIATGVLLLLAAGSQTGEASPPGVFAALTPPDADWRDDLTPITAAEWNRERAAQWQGNRMLKTKRPLEEKLALFWHGHFATGNQKVRDYRKMMAQWDLYRTKGNGSFRELLLGVCRDPAMLVYLDGARNVRGEPNENFAREIMELFALGVGNYREADVKEAARAFTGWGLYGNDFRQVYASVLTEWMGVADSTSLLRGDFAPLELLGG